MRSRLDELHAHQYGMQRLASALVQHDANPSRPLFRGILTYPLVGGAVALLIAAGMLVYGIFTGGTKTDLRNSATVFIEQESGQPFVYIEAGDKLHPAVNYASALLLANGTGGRPTTIRRSSLVASQRAAKVSTGTTLGIMGAPSWVPAPADLLTSPWHLCSGTDAEPRSQLIFDAGGITGGRPLAVPGAASPGQALLVRGPGARNYLIYAQHKFEIRNLAATLVAFGWNAQPTPVAPAWLNALPSGPDVTALEIVDLGKTSQVPDAKVGQLYRTPGPGNTPQWAIAARDTAHSITDVQAQLLLADPTIRLPKVIELSAAAYAALSPTPLKQTLLPATPPSLVTPTKAVCLTIADGASGVTGILTDPDVAPGTPVTATTTAVHEVRLGFKRGVLVESMASPQAPLGSGTVSLITDTGLRYPIADPNAMIRLGYGRSTPQRMPAELVALLPTGPPLSTTAVRTTQEQ